MVRSSVVWHFNAYIVSVISIFVFEIFIDLVMIFSLFNSEFIGGGDGGRLWIWSKKSMWYKFLVFYFFNKGKVVKLISLLIAIYEHLHLTLCLVSVKVIQNIQNSLFLVLLLFFFWHLMSKSPNARLSYVCCCGRQPI